MDSILSRPKSFTKTNSGLIIPSSYASRYKDPKDNKAKMYYVVKSNTYKFSQEIAEDLVPMFRSSSLDECKWYVADKMRHDQALGYELYDVDTRNGYIIILRLEPSGGAGSLLPFNASQFICYAIFSDKQANAMTNISMNE